MATRIQVRRDSAANWTSNNPTLAEGEIGFETDTGLLKVGKSNTPWISLEYTQDSLPSYELYAKIQNFDPNTFPTDDDTTNQSDMEIGDVLVLDADTTNSAFALGDRVRANSVSEREYVFTNLSSALFNSASASIRTSVYNEETQQDDVTPGDTIILTTTNPNLAIKVGSYLSLYRNTNPIFGIIYVEVKSISSNKLTYTCELTGIQRTEVFNEETQTSVPQEFTATSWNALFTLGSTPSYHYPAYPQSSGVFDEGDSLAGVIPYAYLEGVITGLNANSASITIDNLGPSGAPYWFENMKISLAPGRDGLGYGYNVARNPEDPSFSNTDTIDFSNITLQQQIYLYKNLAGAYKPEDRVRVTFTSNSNAWIEGYVSFVDDKFGGALRVYVDDWNKDFSSSVNQADAQVSLIAEPSRSYQLRKRILKNGQITSQNSTFNFTTEKIWEISNSFMMAADYSLFENGDWIKAEFVDYDGNYGPRYKVYSDTWFEGIVHNNSNGFFEVRITNYRNPNEFSGNEFKTSKIPAPKATYDLLTYVYGAGDSNLGTLGYSNPPFQENQIGSTDQTLYGNVGLYQVGQKIRLQYADQNYEAIPDSYAICEITGIQKRVSGGQDEALLVTVLDVNYQDGTSGISSYSLHAPDGAQGPGYEVTWVDGTHSLPDDPQTNWMIGQTVWKAGDQYNIPGDFTNSAYKVGDYVKHLFNTGSYETDWWIEGWITAISTPGATISVQRWGDTDWTSVLASSPGYWLTTYAHFEPGYNFDTYLSQNTYATLNIPRSYNYLNNMIQNPDVNDYIELSGHLGSYKPGDYVIVSSKSNPLIKFTAYLVHAGLAGINGYASNFFPIEILSWDGDPDTGIEDFTLSPMPTPEVGYSFPYPYPNPTKATLDSPTFNGPMAYSALTTQTYPLLINDVIQVRGVPGLYEVGDKVRAYDPYDKDAQFYGEISSIGSASNEWVSEITVKDPTVFTSSASTSNHNYKIALEERKAPLLSENIYPSYDGNSEYYIQSSDIGKTIIANGGVVTYVVSNSSEIPPGSQVTIIQSGGSSGDVGIRGATFIETDGITDGQVQLKGPYGAATIVKIWGTTASSGSEWIVVGNFLSASTP